MRSISAVIMMVVLTTSSGAAEKPVRLKPGAGLDKVEAHCGGCHSLDYLPMNSPFLNAAGWATEVAKMINAFGAPIEESDAKIISDYLSKNYGPTSSRPSRRNAPTTGAQPPQSERDLFPPSLQNKADQRNGSDPKSR